LINIEDMSVLETKKIYNSPFIRRCFVGICSFFYEILEIKMESDKEIKIIKVPILPSLTGGTNSDDFINDLFLPDDKYCEQLNYLKHVNLEEIPNQIKGNLKTIPSGTISYDGSIGLMVDDVIADNSRMVHKKIIENNFGDEIREFSSRVEIIPISLSFNVKIRCSSELERLLIFDEILDQRIWKVRKFYISWNGFEKIPCAIEIPDTIEMEKNLNFSYNELEKRPEINFGINFVTYRPIIDKRTTYSKNNKSRNNSFNIND
jgi:hypothetical protein